MVGIRDTVREYDSDVLGMVRRVENCADERRALVEWNRGPESIAVHRGRDVTIELGVTLEWFPASSLIVMKSASHVDLWLVKSRPGQTLDLRAWPECEVLGFTPDRTGALLRAIQETMNAVCQSPDVDLVLEAEDGVYQRPDNSLVFVQDHRLRE